MIGLSNALQTRVYKILQESQNIQVETKATVKDKISRQITTVDPDLPPERVQEMIENPEVDIRVKIGS